jgi:hypothetical protein
MACRKIIRGVVVAAWILASVRIAPAQSEQQSSRGLDVYEAFDGSTNSEGQVMTLTSSVTYRFNEHFNVGVGLPIYFNRPSSTITGATSSEEGHHE